MDDLDNGVNGREHVSRIISKCDMLLNLLEKRAADPNKSISLNKLFSPAEAEKLVGRTRQTLHVAEKQHGVVKPERNEATGRIVGYSLEQINELREYFNTAPRRAKDDPCLKVAIQSFKGGVAKTITSIHFARYLAIKGYRVLLVDFDAQASATLSMGFNPDRDFSDSDTLLPYLEGKEHDLEYCVKKTYFPGISLIPSCLQFYSAEYRLAHKAATSKSEYERMGYFTEFVDAFKSVEKNFDVIIFDSPPALGMVTINILTAADALIVPTPPALYDISSTAQYFKMIKSVFDDIAPDKQYKFIKILTTRADLRKSKNADFVKMMEEVFAGSIFKEIFHSTSAIDTSTAEFKSIYEANKEDKRAIAIAEKVFREIETQILKCWPSKVSVLEEEGVI